MDLNIKRIKLAEFAELNGLTNEEALEHYRNGDIDGIEPVEGRILVSGWNAKFDATAPKSNDVLDNILDVAGKTATTALKVGTKAADAAWDKAAPHIYRGGIKLLRAVRNSSLHLNDTDKDKKDSTKK
jgi:hypothetical protein